MIRRTDKVAERLPCRRMAADPTADPAASRFCRWCACLSLWLAALCSPVQADQRSLTDLVADVSPSVVAVGLASPTAQPPFQFLGTGFAVGDGLQIATNAHVLPAELDQARFQQLAVAVISQGQVRVRPARLDRRADPHDLAVLRIDGDPLPALRLARDAEVDAGLDIVFTGFPLGNAIGLVAATHRGMVSAVAPIALPAPRARDLNPATIRQLARDPFRIYQLDATAYPGNSGSPVVDTARGEVIGVINMVFVKNRREAAISDPSGISYAIPVRYLRELL